MFQLEQLLNKFGISMGIKGTRGVVSRLCEDAHKKALGWTDSISKALVRNIHAIVNW